jgi:hypothetical protein
MGHLRPCSQLLPAIRCLLWPESDPIIARTRNDAKGQYATSG